MKKFERLNWYFLVAAVFVVAMTSCDLLDKDDELAAEDAKMEIRAAGEDIMYSLNSMMETPAMVSLMYLSELMDLEFDGLKSAQSRRQSAFLQFLSQKAAGGHTMMLPGSSKVLNMARALNTQKSSQFEEFGVFNYNFSTNEFDLVNADVTYLELNFPSDEQAYNNQQRNAKLRLSNIEIVVVETYDEYWDEYDEQEVPISIDATQWINNQVVMEMTYRATLNDNGLPVSTSLSFDMQPYSMSMTHSGSNRDYTTKASLKLNSTTLLGIDMKLRYTADQEEVEKAEGSITVNPLKFEGNIKPDAISMCDENLSCMNKNIDMEVYQTELNKKIGKLEFRMYYDAEYNEEYPELVIVYADKSFEYLSYIFEDIFY